MLEKLFYISCFLAFFMKLISKGGMFYKFSKFCRLQVLDFAFRYDVPELIQKAFTCVPCRFFWLGCISTYIIFCYYWKMDYEFLIYPFVIGAMSSILYRFINPNHEEN